MTKFVINVTKNTERLGSLKRGRYNNTQSTL